jgi:hypothetical protein
MATTFQSKKKAKPMGKAVTISARISQEDAQFLSQYKVEGAITPSDKLRAIITETRERQHRLKDYRGSINMFQSLLAPVDAEIRELELQHQTHSELITRILEWLPDMMAFIIASETKLNKNTKKAELEKIEEGIADRVFRLIESVMQMGVTQRCPCYDSKAISSRVEPVLDLARVISK